MAECGRLVIVPTPIGNLGDMTRRGVEALETCDVVCAEDTRVTAKLLSHLNISKKLERLDETMIASKADAVLDWVRSGKVVAYCTDAGMPGVSDPGMRLIAAARNADVPVEVLPGPTAAVTAYVASGSVARSFYFGGFFPRKPAERRKMLERLKPLDAALLFYESPHRVVEALTAIAEVLPDRPVCVCRELTKLHEECLRGAAADLAAELADREARGQLRGEIVLVIDAPTEQELLSDAEDAEAAAQKAAAVLAADGMRAKEIARKLADDYGISRNVAYDMATRAVKGA